LRHVDGGRATVNGWLCRFNENAVHSVLRTTDTCHVFTPLNKKTAAIRKESGGGITVFFDAFPSV
jgi:hypothetical protein